MIKANYNMNNIFRVNIPKHITADDTFVKQVEKFFDDSERLVPEYGSFGTIKTVLKNMYKDLDIKKVELTFKPSILLKERPKERELEAAFTSVNNNVYSIVIKRGEKNELRNFLKDKAFYTTLDEQAKKASDKFSDLD